VNSSKHLLRKQWSALSLDNNAQRQDTMTTMCNSARESATST